MVTAICSVLELSKEQRTLSALLRLCPFLKQYVLHLNLKDFLLTHPNFCTPKQQEDEVEKYCETKFLTDRKSLVQLEKN